MTYSTLKQTVRKYYKYQYSTFTQPVLTANGTMGGSTFATAASSNHDSSGQPYTPFAASGWCWQAYGDFPQWLAWYNPEPIKITKITITNLDYEARANVKNYKIQACNDYSSWTDVVTGLNTDNGSGTSWDIDMSSNTNLYKYYRIYMTDSYYLGNFVTIARITLTAQTRTIVEGTSTDYDFYEDVDVYKAVKQTTRNYYKYQSWTQPVLAENGTIGGSSFAVLPSSEYSTSSVDEKAYRLFDGTSSVFQFSAEAPQYLIIYNPNPLNITNMVLTNYTGSTAAGHVWTAGNVQGSNDNSTWTTVTTWTNSVIASGSTWNIDLSSNTSNYKYYKVNVTAWNSGAGSSWGIESKMDLTAQKVVAGTSTDYDFYEDVDVYKALRS